MCYLIILKVTHFNYICNYLYFNFYSISQEKLSFYLSQNNNRYSKLLKKIVTAKYAECVSGNGIRVSLLYFKTKYYLKCISITS